MTILKNSLCLSLAAALLAACGGGGAGGSAPPASPIGVPDKSLPAGANPGWKISWGDGARSAQIFDATTGKLVSQTAWPVAAVFQALLAEEIPGSLPIDEGPHIGQPTNLVWKGTGIPYDSRYHPLTAAVCKTSDGAWAGFGEGGVYAVYVDGNGVGQIYGDHLLWKPGMNVVSTHTVPGVGAPTACGAGSTWFTAYYDRGSNGPGTIAFK